MQEKYATNMANLSRRQTIDKVGQLYRSSAVGFSSRNG